VENYIPRPASHNQEVDEAKRRLGLPTATTVLGVIGRIEFRQKAQDWLARALGEDPFLEGKSLIFVGDGPDSRQLAELVRSSPWRSNIFIFDWSDKMDEIYNAIDLLLIPSRVEGVPLVMLDALARRIPVVASDRDGMKSWLPAAWRFPFGDAVAMKQAIGHALDKSQQGDWPMIEKHLVRVTDEERFAREFGNALLKYCA
jgi:glycosyltransferase involved in cell wall biosynthesis